MRTLEASEYKYYIAQGDSLKRIKEYDSEVKGITTQLSEIADKIGADKVNLAQWAGFGHPATIDPSNCFPGYTVSSFTFIDGIPFGWKPQWSTDAVPDRSLNAGLRADFMLGALNIHTWASVAQHIGAPILRNPDGRKLFPVARCLEDGQWIIACPISDKGESFTPKDAEEIDLENYAILTEQALDNVKSPAKDKAFEHPALHEYPYEVKPERVDDYARLLQKDAENKKGVPFEEESLVPYKKPTKFERFEDSNPRLGALVRKFI